NEQALVEAAKREEDFRRHHELALAEAEQREEELGRRQRFFASLLENLDAGVVAWDEQGEFVLLNPMAQAYLALPEQALNLEEWLPHHHLGGSDGSALSEAANPFLRAPNGEWVRRTAIQMVPKEGATRILSASGGPFHDDGGSRRGAVLVLHDVTEHHRVV